MSTVRIRDLKVKVEKADKGHYYIQVQGRDGKFKTSHVKLSGAENMFAKNSDYVYVRPLRHSGSHQDVHDYLVNAGFDEAQVKKYMADSYTAKNFIKMLNEYNREMSKIPQAPPRERLERAKISMDYIISCSKPLSDFKLESSNKASSPVPMTPKITAAGGKADLKMRLAGLTEDKVLEISNFEAEKKKGLKTINRPTKTTTKHAVGGTNDLKRIFFDFSKPIENGINALVFLGFSQEKAKKIMNDAHSKHNDLSNIAVKH
jgi:hypothetical protein